jgi:hypothetical protein
MNRRFVPCAACRRHVKETEAACPFCGEAAARPAAVRPVVARLSRAALFSAGAAGSFVLLVDCGSSSSGNCSNPNATAFYGVAPTECAPTGPGGDAAVPDAADTGVTNLWGDAESG